MKVRITQFKFIIPKHLSDIHSDNIDLLCYKKGDESHYVYITDLSKLIGAQLLKHEDKKYLFRRCLTCFYSNRDLFRHLEIYRIHDPH